MTTEDLSWIPDWMEPFDPDDLAPEGDPEHDCDGAGES